MRWPADPVRKEKESFSWHILQDELWNPTYKDVHLAWRYTGETLAKLTAAERASGKRHRASATASRSWASGLER